MLRRLVVGISMILTRLGCLIIALTLALTYYGNLAGQYAV